MSKAKLIFIGTTVSLIFLFLSCDEGKREISPQVLQNKIVFICGDGICTINPDGSDLKQVTSSKRRGAFSWPSWSSAKDMMGATVHVGKTPQVILISSDGSRVDTLCLPEDRGKKKKRSIYFRGWTQGGDFIFSSGAFENSRIGVMNDQGGIKKVLKGNYPDGFDDKIVYLGYGYTKEGMGTDIMLFAFAEGRNFNLTQDKKIQYYLPTGSFGGEKIAFVFTSQESKEGLWVMNSDGTGRKMLAKRDTDYLGTPMRTIEFSPDGQKILFVPDNGNESEIYVINTDGSGLRGVTGGITLGRGGASWSPDGEMVVFTSNKDGNEELYIVNVDGTGLKRLTNEETKDCCPDW